MSTHDETVLRHRVYALEQCLKEVCDIVEAIPERDRIRLGLYSMPAFNRAYALLKDVK